MREIVGDVRDGIERMNKIGIVDGDAFSKNILVSIDERVVWTSAHHGRCHILWTMSNIRADGGPIGGVWSGCSMSCRLWVYHFLLRLTSIFLFPGYRPLIHIGHISSLINPAPPPIVLPYHRHCTPMFVIGDTSTFYVMISVVLRLTNVMPL
jgi:hypothetical protein